MLCYHVYTWKPNRYKTKPVICVDVLYTIPCYTLYLEVLSRQIMVLVIITYGMQKDATSLNVFFLQFLKMGFYSV